MVLPSSAVSVASSANVADVAIAVTVAVAIAVAMTVAIAVADATTAAKLPGLVQRKSGFLAKYASRFLAQRPNAS